MNDIIIVSGIPLSVSGVGLYDGCNKENEIDFSINRDSDNYIILLYNSNISDIKKAFLKKLKAKTLEQAVDKAFNFKQKG